MYNGTIPETPTDIDREAKKIVATFNGSRVTAQEVYDSCIIHCEDNNIFLFKDSFDGLCRAVNRMK